MTHFHKWNYIRLAVWLSACFAVILGSFICVSCGPLPRPGSFEGVLAKWPMSSDATGLVIAATDSSYSSTDLYFYNFGTGQMTPLATGESGDVIGKWDGRRYWFFNRAAGHTSYSSLSPKMGPSSRSTERRTPGADVYDPVDWIHIGEDESLLALGATHQLSVVNLARGIDSPDDLTEVTTSDADIPFRPGLLVKYGEDIAVFHQALDSSWKARGGGAFYLARRGSGQLWGWVDQNVALAGIQGVSIHVSNPVAAFECGGDTCLIAGACYESMGTGCVGGVDEITWSTKVVRHLFDWPQGMANAGGVAAGIESGSLLACLKRSTDSEAVLARISSSTGEVLASWGSGSDTCGSFEVDAAGGRIIAVKSGESTSDVVSLSRDMTEGSSVRVGFKVSGLELVNE